MADRDLQYGRASSHAVLADEQRLASQRRKAVAQGVSVALLAGLTQGPLLAQERQLEEIVVTATKRAESLMDVPLAITALSGEAIREVNLNDVKDLISFTPGITGNSKDSFLDFVSIRGIRTIDFGNGGDPSVSLYKNGLYQGRTGSAVSSLYDIERAEVLRGPQGFLFGRNSVSGAMNIITAKPNLDASSGYAELDLGERGVFVFEGAANIPVSDTFALRIAGYHSEEDGFVENLAGGPDLIAHDKNAIRVTGRVQTQKLTADLMLEYEDRDQTGTVYRQTGQGRAFTVHQTRINGGVPIEVSPDGRTVNNDNTLEPIDLAEIFHVGLQLDYDLGNMVFTSLTGYKDHDYAYIEDYDGSPLVLFNYGQDQTGDYFEQEFRLTSTDDGPLSWYAGASYYSEDIDTVFLGQMEEDAYCLGYWYYNCQDLFDYYNSGPYAYYLYYYFGSYVWNPTADGLVNDRNRIIGKYKGYSAYADLSYRFNESFDVSVGLRYTYDEKQFSQEVLPDPGGSLLAYKVQTGFSTPNGALTDKQDWDEVTWRVIANWRPNDSTLLFGSITTGYKPGDFGPETVTSYEVGYKGTILGGGTQIAATAFFYDYEDLQAIFTEGLRVIVDNVGQVDGTGAELEVITALTDHLDLRFGASWFDSEATNVQAFCGAGEELLGDPDICDGQSIPWAPEWTAFTVLRGNYPVGEGEAFGHLSWSWEDDYRGDWPNPSVIYQRIKALNQTDIVLGYRQDSWRVSAYVENVFDQIWYDGAYSDDPGQFNIYSQHTFGPSRPRTAGVRFGIDFD